MNTSSQTLSIAQTRDALDLVRSLAIHSPELPAPYITLHTGVTRVLLSLQVDHGAFEAWREALAIDTDAVHLVCFGTDSHVTVTSVVETKVSNHPVRVMVELYGVGLPALTDRPADPQEHGLPIVTLAEAVALMGALPVPSAGELAEQRHLVDPLDHTLEHLADEVPQSEVINLDGLIGNLSAAFRKVNNGGAA